MEIHTTFDSNASLKAIKNILISAMNEIDKKELAMAVARAIDIRRKISFI